MRPSTRLSLERIERFARTIDPVFLRSPQYPAEALGEVLACRLVVKVETANPIRSFKGRGADAFVSELAGAERLVCASAGNFGQAVAYACRRRGLTSVVYASVNASPLKLERMRALGADVRLAGNDFDAAKDAARQHAADEGAWMVEDGREPAISEGAGTIGFELLAGPWTLDAVVVPLGNGALLGGIARVVKAARPDAEVIGVCAAGAPAMERSWRSDSIVELPADTIADGIGVRVPIPEAVEDLRDTVDDVVLVDDETLVEAVRACHRHLGLVVEPAGGAGVAAILADPDRFSGRTVATVLAGGNLSEEQVARWLVSA